MEECYFGHHFNGVSAFCTECGVRLMDDDHIEFNRIQMENKTNGKFGDYEMYAMEINQLH